MNNNGVIIRRSPLPVKETIDKIMEALSKNGATIYLRINQQSEANKAGIILNPLEFILFGNPKRGGEVMQENPVAALDLPLKIIAWQDDELKTWVYFNDAVYLQSRFSLSHEVTELIDMDPVVIRILQQ
ncbi:Uncharacterized conserved protein, DUF302 family [Mucilaginibacter gossypiicola]|uniref:Uncharacterized conserved protein, DUF302 family n=1 Tax=Mucilaginibacter gossypiicola TaxID=551995 RepID=A0A1H8M4X3_9SPHI|nr:DUF302 domain-containing protein [Mucilaginibacter gossypiicola]SEO12423.1 Uncharacterized conserved protein, DUF302 family [Mucilaginibacter gossypiicola]